MKPFFKELALDDSLKTAIRGSIFNCCEARMDAYECNSLYSKILSISGIHEVEASAKVPYVA